MSKFEAFSPKNYRDGLANKLKDLRNDKQLKDETEEFLSNERNTQTYIVSEKFKKHENLKSKYVITEHLEKLGGQIVLVREIIVPEKLLQKLNSAEGLSLDEQTKYFDYFYEITEGRYPSYKTLNHVIGGGDFAYKGKGNLIEGLNVKGEIERSFVLPDKDIENILEQKTDVKKGFCVGMGYSEYFAEKRGDGLKVNNGKNEWSYIDNRNKPLLIFGSKNKKFTEFVKKKI